MADVERTGDSPDPGGWLAPVSGAIAVALALAWVSLYLWGRSLPAERVTERTIVVQAPIGEVWALVGDLARRPEWHPELRTIGRVEDRDGHPVWRELDPGGDRFDWIILEQEAPHRLVTEAADPEQIGLEADWTWELAEVPSGTRVTLAERGRIDNPVWRGAYALRYGADGTVERELEALAAAFDRPHGG